MLYVPRSPLTWPGGKFRALPDIIIRIPEFQEHREPFAGSASVFFELQSRYPAKKFWINDLNQDLANFYIMSKNHGARISEDIHKLKNSFGDGKELLNHVMSLDNTEYNRALRFFVLNRITYYGIGVSRQHTESKSFSLFKYERKFTNSLIDRVSIAGDLLKDVKITNLSYESCLQAPGEDVFLFLDPPYKLDKHNDLYGKHGCFHKNFNYLELSENLQACEHSFLMTINDIPEFRDIFSWARVEHFTVPYCMGSQKLGKELFISNFKPKFFKNASLTAWGLSF